MMLFSGGRSGAFGEPVFATSTHGGAIALPSGRAAAGPAILVAPRARLPASSVRFGHERSPVSQWPAVQPAPRRQRARARGPHASTGSKTELPEVVIDVLVGPPMPVLPRPRSHHEMHARETSGRSGRELVEAGNGASAVALEITGPRALLVGIHARARLDTLRPRHRGVQDEPLEQWPGLP